MTDIVATYTETADFERFCDGCGHVMRAGYPRWVIRDTGWTYRYHPRCAAMQYGVSIQEVNR